MFSLALPITIRVQCFTFTRMHPTIRLALLFAFPQYESRAPHLSQPMLFDFYHESSIYCCCSTSVYLIQFSAMLTDPLGHTPHFLEHYMLCLQYFLALRHMLRPFRPATGSPTHAFNSIPVHFTCATSYTTYYLMLILDHCVGSVHTLHAQQPCCFGCLWMLRLTFHFFPMKACLIVAYGHIA